MNIKIISNLLDMLNCIKEKTILSNFDIDFATLKNEKLMWEFFESDCLSILYEDKLLDDFLLNHTLQGILCYRISRCLYINKREKDALIASNLGRILSGFEIYYSAEIGYGLKINHGLGTVIGARTVIGNNLLVHQGVTFGDNKGNRPIIGNNVIIYAGAKILGGIKIGDNAVIGANAAVLTDVPNNKKAVDVPARILND